LLKLNFSSQPAPPHIWDICLLYQALPADAWGRCIPCQLQLSFALWQKAVVFCHTAGIYQDHASLHLHVPDRYNSLKLLLSFVLYPKAPTPYHIWGICPVLLKPCRGGVDSCSKLHALWYLFSLPLFEQNKRAGS